MSLMYPKPARLESPPYLRFVRDHQCVVPKCFRRSQANHIVFDGQGRTGSKVSDYFAVPCCEKHHSEYHALGRDYFAEKHALNFEQIIIGLLVEYVAAVRADQYHQIKDALSEYANPMNWAEILNPQHPEFPKYRLMWNHQEHTEGPDLAKGTLEELDQ